MPARAVPTSTGAIAAGSVRGLAATSQIRNGTRPPRAIRIEASIRGQGLRGKREKSGLRFST